jgi:hypothetical protein
MVFREYLAFLVRLEHMECLGQGGKRVQQVLLGLKVREEKKDRQDRTVVCILTGSNVHGIG